MPCYYTCSCTPVQLDEAQDDVGVRLDRVRPMVLHEAGAGRSPSSAIANALPRTRAGRAARPVPIYRERESGLKLMTTDEILVEFKAGAPAARKRMLLEGLGLRIVGHSEFDPHRHTVVPKTPVDPDRTLRLANKLAEADVVEFAAPNFFAQVRKATVNDPRFADQWHLDNRGQGTGIRGHDVRALGAWKTVGGGDRSIVIAIIDDGIDLDHPDLKDNLWKNPRPGARDRHGRDFTDLGDPFNPRARFFRAPFDDTETNDIHGTPCAGVAAAVGNNGRGVAGMAWNCRLMAVKILAGGSKESVMARQDRIADAIRYASTHADVLSCSWAVSPSPDIESAITFAVKRGRRGRGSVVCAATGNEAARRICFPSKDDRVVAVGACDNRGLHAEYSNRGRGITLVAPSDRDTNGLEGITTTDVSVPGRGYATGAYCNDFGGTSSATPLVAGVAALVLSAKKSLRWDEVRDVLTATADKIDARNGNYRNGYSAKFGFGRVNAEAAVSEAKER